ncbi:hypothetical protein QR98_0091080 [Sarcoptes scabiei]|uniref:Uncharacterized protein n=1 Tax=Sarcoptes scabiei TaxID=52283 RepID=A0A132AJC0_SARSC|nr:hypothetical protein QR98_0091080 [Sarcoptes scabiei]
MAAIVNDIINCFHFENGKISFRPTGVRQLAKNAAMQNPNLNNIVGMLSQFKGPAMSIIKNVANEIGKDLKIGQMVENVEQMDEKTLNDLKNAQMRRQQNLLKSEWRESVTSLKPQDNIYKVSLSLSLSFEILVESK